MEDAPLIYKKGMYGDKCGSCNQIIAQELNYKPNGPMIASPINLIYNQNNQIINTPNNNNYSTFKKSNEPNKIRNIQDVSSKLNGVSYSRILTNTENLQEDLNKPPFNSSTPNRIISTSQIKSMVSSLTTPQNQNLPNINSSSNNLNNINNINNLKTNSKNDIDSNPLSPFKEEFEKKNPNGNMLVMKANKEFDRKAKDRKNQNINS